MPNTPTQKPRSKKRLRLALIAIGLLLILLNLLIIVTGNSYLYKGVQETYLKGRSGPSIYDSIVFPNRVAKHSDNPEAWQEESSLISLDNEAIELLNSYHSTSFLVIKDEKIISETYFENHQKHTKSHSFSVGKSFIGLLIGIAVDEGYISSWDDPIKDYLPFRLTNDDDVTIRDVMAMSSDLIWSESGKNPLSHNAEAYYTSNLTKMMEKLSFEKDKTWDFEYKSGYSELLGIILKEATGKNPTEYLEEKVWSKIGAENDVYWSLDNKDGIEKTFCCIYATTRDYAKFGQLVLNQGSWNEEQIISAENMSIIGSPHSEKFPHYGLHFWIYNHPKHPAVYARGILGQYIVAVPSLNAVFVRTGHERAPSYIIPPEKHNDAQFMLENGFKEFHAGEFPEYFEMFLKVIEEATN